MSSDGQQLREGEYADRDSYLMTDESGAYVRVGREFSGHGMVNHSIIDALNREFDQVAARVRSIVGK